MKRKITYSLSALLLAMIITISGIGNSYIKAEASSGVFDVLWNTDATFSENVGRHLLLFANVAGCFVDPTLTSAGILAINAGQFYDWMISDGYSEEEANEVVHGGGGFVRDGITRDSNGNVTYSDEVSDLFHSYLTNFLDTDCGYWVVETMAADELPIEWVGLMTSRYSNIVQTIKNLGFCLVHSTYYTKEDDIRMYYPDFGIYSLGSFEFCLTVEDGQYSPSDTLFFITKGTVVNRYAYHYSNSSQYEILRQRPMTLNDFTISSTEKLPIVMYEKNVHGTLGDMYNANAIFTDDGRLVKVFKSLAAYRNYDAKNQSYHYTENWVKYDYQLDNSMTISNSEYQYYIDNSSTVYNNVQNIVNNSGSDLTEDDIQRIVEDELKKFKDNMKEEEKEDDITVPDDDSGNDSGGGGSVSGNGTGGTGIGDFVGGLGSLLDFILSLLGKVIGLISDFLNSALELLGNLTSFTDGFSSFLTAAFGFLPEEAVTLICSGIALLITLGIIKYMRN